MFVYLFVADQDMELIQAGCKLFKVRNRKKYMRVFTYVRDLNCISWESSHKRSAKSRSMLHRMPEEILFPISRNSNLQVSLIYIRTFNGPNSVHINLNFILVVFVPKLTNSITIGQEF